ncbi:glycosyl transferase [Bryobacterales bacterium F-183]|nr:glycosyl transferase [Bryobacterales bacterium F-183]
MRVAFVITRADAVGGATVHVRDLASAAQARGMEVRVFVGGTKQGPVTEQLSKRGIEWRLVPALGRAIHPVRDLQAIVQLSRMLKEYAPNLVSCHTAKAGLVGRLAARRAGIPAIFTPHGWSIGDRLSPLAGRVFTVVERTVAPASARIVNVCEAERRLAAKAKVGKAAQMAVIHNGVVDVDPSLRAEAGRRSDVVELVTVARMESPKDHATLLRALARIAALPWRLTWIGEGPLQAEVIRLAKELGVEDRIVFRGAAESSAPALAASQVFVLSSRSEGFPRSILEALRAGLPVVASNVGGIRESVSHRGNGFLFESGNAADCAHQLRELIEDAALRGTMGALSRKRYENEFTFERMMEATLRMWNGVLAQEQTHVSETRSEEEPLLEGTSTR